MCYNGAIHEGTLSQNSTAEVKIRQFVPNQNSEIQCYFWSLRDGNTVQHTKEHGDNEMFQSIVSFILFFPSPFKKIFFKHKMGIQILGFQYAWLIFNMSL